MNPQHVERFSISEREAAKQYVGNLKQLIYPNLRPDEQTSVDRCYEKIIDGVQVLRLTDRARDLNNTENIEKGAAIFSALYMLSTGKEKQSVLGRAPLAIFSAKDSGWVKEVAPPIPDNYSPAHVLLYELLKKTSIATALTTASTEEAASNAFVQLFLRNFAKDPQFRDSDRGIYVMLPFTHKKAQSMVNTSVWSKKEYGGNKLFVGTTISIHVGQGVTKGIFVFSDTNEYIDEHERQHRRNPGLTVLFHAVAEGYIEQETRQELIKRNKLNQQIDYRYDSERDFVSLLQRDSRVAKALQHRNMVETPDAAKELIVALLRAHGVEGYSIISRAAPTNKVDAILGELTTSEAHKRLLRLHR